VSDWMGGDIWEWERAEELSDRVCHVEPFRLNISEESCCQIHPMYWRTWVKNGETYIL